MRPLPGGSFLDVGARYQIEVRISWERNMKSLAISTAVLTGFGALMLIGTLASTVAAS
jgi:hypothetical protein